MPSALRKGSPAFQVEEGFGGCGWGLIGGCQSQAGEEGGCRGPRGSGAGVGSEPPGGWERPDWRKPVESVQNEMGKMQAQLAQGRVHHARDFARHPRQAPGAVPTISVQLPQIECFLCARY